MIDAQKQKHRRTSCVPTRRKYETNISKRSRITHCQDTQQLFNKQNGWIRKAHKNILLSLATDPTAEQRAVVPSREHLVRLAEAVDLANVLELRLYDAPVPGAGEPEGGSL